MLTVAVPMAGSSVFFSDAENKFPKIFSEINGLPMVQVVLENLKTIKQKIRFLFIISDDDVKKYRLDNVLRMLTNDNCDIIVQQGQTKGAVCSLLLGIKYLNHENSLLIANADQIIDHDLNKILNFFTQNKADGGVVCFNSIHPQWSYARVDKAANLLETAEKEPISNNAIAGLYYFGRGCDFVNSAMKSIEKSRSYNNLFYTSLTYNEMILQSKKLLVYSINSNEYHSFYSPSKIQEYEKQAYGRRV